MTTWWQSMQSKDTKNMNLEKDFGRHTVHSQKSGMVRRRGKDKVVEAVGGWRTMNAAASNLKDGMHSVLGSRMDLPHGDESVTKCLYACVHKGARKGFCRVHV